MIFNIKYMNSKSSLDSIDLNIELYNLIDSDDP